MLISKKTFCSSIHGIPFKICAPHSILPFLFSSLTFILSFQIKEEWTWWTLIKITYRRRNHVLRYHSWVANDMINAMIDDQVVLRKIFPVRLIEGRSLTKSTPGCSAAIYGGYSFCYMTRSQTINAHTVVMHTFCRNKFCTAPVGTDGDSHLHIHKRMVSEKRRIVLYQFQMNNENALNGNMASDLQKENLESCSRPFTSTHFRSK